MLPDEPHGLAPGHPVQHGEACESGAGPAAPTAAADLHPIRPGPVPGLAQGVLRVAAIHR